MHLFLIRHGETVDNVAQLYAGSRDSKLTNHGFNQATRLGQYFHSVGVTFTHIFSSHLKRAVKTAEQIRVAQDGLVVVQSALIMEQDFGSSEGKPFGKRAFDQVDNTDSPLVPSETRESMNDRIDTFLNEHLIPIMTAPLPADPVIALVSHGIILGVLWRRLLQRLPPRSIQMSPEIVASQSMIVLEHLGRWGNTCYLELNMKRRSAVEEEKTTSDEVDPTASTDIALDAHGELIPRHLHPSADLDEPAARVVVGGDLLDFITTVERVNSREHLKNLKRTGGGVGSAEYDEGQKGIASFFKQSRRP